MNEWLLIVLMALVTFLPRYLPFALAGRVKLPAALERGLDFVPVAVLTAIIAQTTLIRGGELDLTIGNLHAIAAAAAFITALVTRHLFLTIAVGLVVFAVLKLVAV
jgi:branched-subunit amino acid transport protein